MGILQFYIFMRKLNWHFSAVSENIVHELFKTSQLTNLWLGDQTDQPKSAIFNWPFAAISMFSGFRSRWITFLLCRYWSALTNCNIVTNLQQGQSSKDHIWALYPTIWFRQSALEISIVTVEIPKVTRDKRIDEKLWKEGKLLEEIVIFCDEFVNMAYNHKLPKHKTTWAIKLAEWYSVKCSLGWDRNTLYNSPWRAYSRRR